MPSAWRLIVALPLAQLHESPVREHRGAAHSSGTSCEGTLTLATTEEVSVPSCCAFL